MSGLPIRIVVADDDKDIVNSLIDQLGSLGSKFGHRLSLFPASSALDVITLLRTTAMDAMFLDYYFEGGMNGDEIISNVDDPFETMLITVMSGRPQQELEGLLIKRHVALGNRFRFVRKPFDSLEVEAAYLQIASFVKNRPKPSPLAYPQRALEGAETWQGRLTALKDIAESLIAYIAVLLTSACTQMGCLAQHRIQLSGDIQLTLGAWLKWSSSLRDQHRKDNSPSQLFPELWRTLNAVPDPFSTVYKFKNEVRDAELGHGFVRDERWYEKIYNEHEKQIRRLLDTFAVLDEYALYCMESLNVLDQNRFACQIRLLHGPAGPYRRTEIRSKHPLKTSEVYVHLRPGQSLSLDPIMKYELCEGCGQSRLFQLDKIDETITTYRSHCNHRITVPNITDAKLPALRALLFEPGAALGT
jgi:CheY-like chemotaxis protein